MIYASLLNQTNLPMFELTFVCRLELNHPLYEELKANFEDHIPLYIARLQALEADKVMPATLHFCMPLLRLCYEYLFNINKVSYRYDQKLDFSKSV